MCVSARAVAFGGQSNKSGEAEQPAGRLRHGRHAVDWGHFDDELGDSHAESVSQPPAAVNFILCYGMMTMHGQNKLPAQEGDADDHRKILGRGSTE